jgi:hypothetical protein
MSINPQLMQTECLNEFQRYVIAFKSSLENCCFNVNSAARSTYRNEQAAARAVLKYSQWNVEEFWFLSQQPLGQ